MPEGAPALNLTPEEKRQYYRLFQIADKTNLGVITGEIAVSFFEKTGLPSETLGQIWQIADSENRGLLTPAGFGVVLRLIGHAQAGRAPSEDLATKPGPLPRFAGIDDAPPTPAAAPPVTPAAAAPINPQSTGPVRVPPLNPDEMSKFMTLFERSEPQNGMIPGDQAKKIFERSELPNQTLGQIWYLVDTQARGALDQTEFIIAMHLLTAIRAKTMPTVPTVLPPGLYEAAKRFTTNAFAPPMRTGSAGAFGPVPARVQSPASRAFMLSPQSTGASLPVQTPVQPPPAAGGEWLVTPAEKQQFDTIFSTVDTTNSGFISGEQAVDFFSKANLDEEVLAQIWDLSDIDSDGQLSRDEFAVAMHLIRQQRAGREPLPSAVPPALIPPSMRGAAPAPAQTAPAPPAPRSAAEDLFGLDVFSQQAGGAAKPPTAPALQTQGTGGSNAAFPPPPAARAKSASNASVPQPAPVGTPPPPSTASASFKPFVPTSSFGQRLQPQFTGQAAPPAATVTAGAPAQPAPGADDLLGDADPEESKKLTGDTTDLANLSNQIGNLSREMQNVQEKRGSTEQSLSQTSAQKRDFEARLAQARTIYQKEVQDFKVLEERLKTSRADTSRKQAEYALLEGQRADLQTQVNNTRTALEADTAENASLKEKIREVNVAIAALKPQLEKLKSEARQQKGLVAINKKQLATVQAEQEKLTSETESVSKEIDDAQKEFREQSHLMSERSTPTPGASGTPVSAAASAAVPAGMNPFFKRVSSRPSTSERAFSPSPVPAAFSPDSGSQRAGTPQLPPAAPKDKESLFDDVFGPMAAKPATPVAQPPPTTSFRAASASPSPVPQAQSPQPPVPAKSPEPQAPAVKEQPGQAVDEQAKHTDAAAAQPRADASPDGMPGSFPEPAHADGQQLTVPAEKEAAAFDDAFKSPSPSQGGVSDLEESFKRFPPLSDSGEQSDVPGDKKPAGQAPAEHSWQDTNEFPEIKEFKGDDDESSDDDEGPEPIPGYKEDPFAPAPPPEEEKGKALEGRRMSQSDYPSAAAHTLPLHEEEQQASPEQGASTSAPPPAQSPAPPVVAVPTPGTEPAKATSPAPAPAPAPAAATSPAPAPAKPAGPSDIDDEFAGVNLAPAKEGEDSSDPEDEAGPEMPNFDFSFDTQPSAPAQPAANVPVQDDFFNFSPAPASAQNVQQQQPQGTAHPAAAAEDWDSLFAGIDKPTHRSSPSFPTIPSSSFPEPPAAQQAQQPQQTKAEEPEDDPILQRLTSMGYARDESLNALEQFDYDLNKAANHLATKH